MKLEFKLLIILIKEQGPNINLCDFCRFANQNRFYEKNNYIECRGNVETYPRCKKTLTKFFKKI